MLLFGSLNDTVSIVHFPYSQMTGLYMMINVTAHKYATRISTTSVHDCSQHTSPTFIPPSSFDSVHQSADFSPAPTVISN